MHFSLQLYKSVHLLMNCVLCWEMQLAETVFSDTSSCVHDSLCFCLSSFLSFDSCLFRLFRFIVPMKFLKRLTSTLNILVIEQNFYRNLNNLSIKKCFHTDISKIGSFGRNNFLKRRAKKRIVEMSSE